MITINPYLTFNGNCEDAFNFYRSIFGGDFAHISKFKDMPEDPKSPISESEKEKIMHISLPINDECTIMGSDSSEAFGRATIQGNNFSISINTDSKDEVSRIYYELSEDGKIKMPLEKTFWGAYFGMFTDKFGIHWMVNCETEESDELNKLNGKEGI